MTTLQQKLNAVSARNDLDKSQISDLQSELEAVYEVSVLHLEYPACLTITFTGFQHRA